MTVLLCRLCFEAEQAVQILLKAYILKYGGVIPRTHSLRRLLGELGGVTDRGGDVTNFVSQKRSSIIMLEDTYLRSRYAVEGYEAADADICLEVAEEVIEFAKKLTKT